MWLPGEENGSVFDDDHAYDYCHDENSEKDVCSRSNPSGEVGVGAWWEVEVVVENVDAQHAGEHEGGGEGDEHAPWAERSDDEVRLREEPVREEDSDGVEDLGCVREPSGEPYSAEGGNSDGDDDRFEEDAEESVREAEEGRLP